MRRKTRGWRTCEDVCSAQRLTARCSARSRLHRRGGEPEGDGDRQLAGGRVGEHLVPPIRREEEHICIGRRPAQRSKTTCVNCDMACEVVHPICNASLELPCTGNPATRLQAAAPPPRRGRAPSEGSDRRAGSRNPVRGEVLCRRASLHVNHAAQSHAHTAAAAAQKRETLSSRVRRAPLAPIGRAGDGWGTGTDGRSGWGRR